MPIDYTNQFFIFGTIPDYAELATYNIFLVVLSYFIASFGAFTGLRITHEINNIESEKFKKIMHIVGAFTFGAGIWSMHFIGMLAYEMNMVHTYDPLLTLASMVFAVTVAYYVLGVVQKNSISAKSIGLSAILLGTAICGMHYTGMAAMDMDAHLLYIPSLFALSVLIAVTASAAALCIVFFLGKYQTEKILLWQILAALIIGLAVCGMHYTGIAATVFIPFADCRYDEHQSFATLALIVTGISSMIFIIALTLILYARAAYIKAKTQEDYTGNIVFYQLSVLLTVLILVIGTSYHAFMETNIRRNHNNDLLNAAGIQRLYISQYLHQASLIIESKKLKKEGLINEHIKIAKMYQGYIDQNYMAFEHGGELIINANGDESVSVAPISDKITKTAITEARKQWKALQLLITESRLYEPSYVVSSNTTTSSLHEKITNQAIEAIHTEDDLINDLQEHYDREQEAAILQQRIIFLIGLVTFILSILYSKFFISDPIERARVLLQTNQDNLEHQVEEQTKDLKESMVRAEQSNQAKSDFLANMSHEIRTPMNAIMGMSRFMLETELDDEQKLWAESISTSGDTLLQIINDIIDISKIEANKLNLEHISFDVFTVLQDVTTLYSLQAREKGIEILIDVDSNTSQFLKGDPVRIKQVFANLISNALKFTEKGHVLISIKQESIDNNMVRLECRVEDTGIGVPKDKQDHIFQKFSQAEESTTREFGGTGLGLAIVSQLVELMGGSIHIESKEGIGSRFIFNLELEQDEHKKSEILENDIKDINILVIDDYDLTCELVHDMLSNHDIGCDIAPSAEDGLNALKKKKYDLCIIDYQMEGMDGLELVTRIRDNKDYDAISLIMLSGAMSSKKHEDLKKIGLDGYLPKPFREAQIINIVNTAISSRRLGHKIPLIAQHNVMSMGESSASQETKTYAQYPGVKVLAVDDIRMNMIVIKKVLSKFGVEIDTASNGLEALEKIKTTDFGVVFMDCQMPEMDGFEATQEVRTFEKEHDKPFVPIVALTADAMIGDREKCISVGMNDYINKPFKDEDIANILEKWL